MTNLALTATPQPRPSSGVPLNLTSLLTGLGSNTGVQFVNSNREVLYVEQGTAATNFTVSIGSTVEGQPVTAITYTGVAGDIQMVGPFNTDFDVQPGDLIEVSFATAASVTGVALVANSGAY